MGEPKRLQSEFKTNTSLSTDAVQSQAPSTRTVHQNMERRALEDRRRKLYLKKYPWATDWSLENLEEFERNAQPLSVNGVIRTPVTYKPKLTTISSDTKTKVLHNQGQKAFQRKLEKDRQLKETEWAAEVINNPYNPIGWIPGIRTLFNIGADLLYLNYHNIAWTPYTADATMSVGTDALTLGFGIGPWKNYAGSYTGTVAGGIIGELFDSPYFGLFIGGMVGGSSPLFTDRIFIPNANSYTRGIGRSTEGLEDLIRTGIVRGNPRGTEVTAHNFSKLWRKNRDHFRDILQATKIPNIENKFFSRTLTELEFDAIKAASKNYTKRGFVNDGTTISFTERPADPLSEYPTYNDYLRIIQEDIAKVEQMPSRIASGEVVVNKNPDGTPTNRPIDERFGANSDYVADGTPLSYWYSDGRNPFTRGHDYAGSNYAVRVNNPEIYVPFIHEAHLHPSFQISPKLSDPNVEVFKRLPFGLGWRMNKSKLLNTQ